MSEKIAGYKTLRSSRNAFICSNTIFENIFLFVQTNFLSHNSNSWVKLVRVSAKAFFEINSTLNDIAILRLEK